MEFCCAPFLHEFLSLFVVVFVFAGPSVGFAFGGDVLDLDQGFLLRSESVYF